jgi:hypothetical protein
VDIQASRPTVQSHSQQAHGSVPFSSRQRLRKWASCTLTSSKYSSQYGRSSSSGVGQKQHSTQRTMPSERAGLRSCCAGIRRPPRNRRETAVLDGSQQVCFFPGFTRAVTR